MHKVAKTGTYSDLIGKPTIPTVNDSTITIQMNGSTVDSFTTNASSGKTINLGTITSGPWTSSVGTGSAKLGSVAYATGTNAVAHGTGSAYGDYSHAEGSSTTANGSSSHAERLRLSRILTQKERILLLSVIGPILKAGIIL